jgi:hypothetical protein
VIGLAGEIRGEVIVDVLRLERGVAQVAPQHRKHAELVRLLEHPAYFLDLPLRFFRAEIDRGADAGGAHVEGLLDAGETDLIVGVRIGNEFVVVELQDKRDLVRVLARAHAEYSER